LVYSLVYLGIVIPTYNERDNIERLLMELINVLNNVKYKIVVVDDNSPDGTADMVHELAVKYDNIHLIKRPGKLGLGSAVLTGFKLLLEDRDVTHIASMDADHSHRPEDLLNMLKEIDRGDVVQGSRYIEGGEIVGWGFTRSLISHTANFIVRTLYKTGLHDHTNNFRIYSRASVERIVRYSTMSSYEWVIEALLITIACGYSVVEVPTKFINREKGKSKLSLHDIWRWWHFIWGYRARFWELINTCREYRS